LNFVQHVKTLLEINGRAAVVVPDNVFFDRKPASETPWTRQLWIYDLRTSKDFTLKTNPLAKEDLNEFIECYNAENRARSSQPAESGCVGAGDCRRSKSCPGAV
jgi:type I restriction enzyme M protein